MKNISGSAKATSPAEQSATDQSSAGLKLTASRCSHGSGLPPYNPGLHELVEGKQAWSQPLGQESKAQGFLGWHQRGYLPHRDVPGLTQFVTFRLCDGLPSARRCEWEALLRIENHRQRRIRLEEYLDRGDGECWLRQPAIARIAENALQHFHEERYRLQAWVIMPNHIHVLLEVWQIPLAQVLQSWKRFIAREANKLLCREGPFWEREYWDTYMRNEEQAIRARRYAEQNPVKARLVDEAKLWHWSSARLRDQYG